MTERRGLSAAALKYIAIAAMLTDHIGWVFFPQMTPLSFVMHVFGRLTAPIMCYFIAEGYFYTRNLKRYFARLLLGAAISHFAYGLCFHGALFYGLHTGVMWTLAVGLAALVLVKRYPAGDIRAFLGVLVCFVLALPGDWSVYAVSWIVWFGRTHGDRRQQLLGLALIGGIFAVSNLTAGIQNLFQFGVLLAVPLLRQYNGQRGAHHPKALFYWFYPVHLLLLAAVRYFVSGG